MLPPKAPSNKDYLREQRQKREKDNILNEQKREEKEEQYQKETWNNVLNDKSLTQEERVERIK